jgi:hypothetical protein
MDGWVWGAKARPRPLDAMKPTALLVNTSRDEPIEAGALGHVAKDPFQSALLVGISRHSPEGLLQKIHRRR